MINFIKRLFGISQPTVKEDITISFEQMRYESEKLSYPLYQRMENRKMENYIEMEAIRIGREPIGLVVLSVPPRYTLYDEETAIYRDSSVVKDKIFSRATEIRKDFQAINKLT